MKRHLLLIALSFCTALSTLAVPITFQLDLGPRINTGEFIPGSDQVVVRGSFNGWAGGVALNPSAENPALYTGTANVTGEAASTVEFKFVQISNGTDTWETTPNRAFTLPERETTLPVAFFNNVWEGFPVPVKFQVNMATQQAAGEFAPAEGDFVEVRGGFNAWSGGFVLSPSAENPDIYEAIAEVPDAPGARVEYKFVINDAITGQVKWENDPNRAFTQTAEPQDLPVVYFNNVTGVPVKAQVNFAVDMSVYLAAGLLDTNTQEVYMRGNKMGWNNPPEGLQLFEDASRPGIFTNTFTSEGQITGDVIEYKATIWTPETQSTTWEDGANKSLTFTGTESKNAAGYHQISIVPAYFNGVEPGTLLNEETIVTFRVDMNNARGTDGTIFNPATDTVAVNGSFLPGGWQPWDALFDTMAFDDGVSGGDETAGDGIYTVQVTLPRGTNSRLVYKYGINGVDNEAGIGNDRVRYVRETGTYLLPLDTFGTITQENATVEIGPVSIARGESGELTISWPAASGARLQKITNLATGAAADVANTEGQTSYTVPTTEPMGFFRLVKP